MADYTVLDFVHALEAALGVPQSTNNDQVLVAWQRAEGNPGWGQYNPYNIAAASVGQGHGGTASFQGWADGVQQTAAFLRHNLYTGIVASLAKDAPPSDTARAIGESPWAAGHYSFAQYGNGEPGGSIIANLGASGQYSPGTPGAIGGARATDSAGNIPADYTQYQFLAKDPVIGGYLNDLAAGHISDATFLNELQNSQWWKTHSGSLRAWEQLKSSDPASYNQQVGEYSRQIVEQAVKLGVGLDPGTILQLANQWGSFDWQPQDVTNAILGYAKQKTATGGLANDMENVRQVADSYGVHLDEQTAWNYATQLAKNQQDPSSLQGIFATQAKSLFPNLAPQIDQGQTVAQIATPYVTAASKLLEVDPSQIDIADPKYQRALAYNDGKNVRQMSQLEWQQTLMSDPTYGWDRTMNARDSAVGLVQQLGQAFGYGN